MDRKEVWAERAERAYDLWGRALDAQIEHLSEANSELPPDKELPINDSLMRFNAEYIELARYLFDRSMSRYNFLENLEGVGAEVAEHKPQPGSENGKVTSRREAVTKSGEELADVTQGIIDGMRAELGSIHSGYAPKKTAEKQSRSWLSKRTEVHIKKGEEELRKPLNNSDIAGLDEVMQVVVWVGQANGPRQAPFKRTPDDRVRYVIEMINLGKPEADDRLNVDQVWELVDMAAEEGLVMGEDADDPKITPKGLDAVRSIFETMEATRSARPAF